MENGKWKMKNGERSLRELSVNPVYSVVSLQLRF